MMRLALLLTTLFLTGCATGTARIRLIDPNAPAPERWTSNYVKEHLQHQVVEPPDDAPLFRLVKFVDDRPRPDILGLKKNTYGMEMGNVALADDGDLEQIWLGHLVNTFAAAGLRLELAHRGLIGEGGSDATPVAHAQVELDSFWAEFMPGFWSVEARSDVRFELELIDPSTSAPIYSQRFDGQGEVSGGAIFAQDFEESLNQAHRNSMHQLLEALRTDIRDRFPTP
jgi:hypothetical protein